MTPNAPDSPAAPGAARTPPQPARRTRRRPVDGVYQSPRFTLAEIQHRLQRDLSLSFSVSDEQATMIQRIDQRFDGIYIAGTGYGKSLIIEGTACLNPRGVVVVICPLKALEYDQVAQAKAKGLSACTINEDLTTAEADAEFAAVARGQRQLVYISPELSLTQRITDLLSNPRFRKFLAAVFVDEAHVVAEWAKSFREAYGFLDRLRSFTGQDIPFVSLSATLNTASFSILWSTFRYGCRPFFGMDLGVYRRTLAYIVAHRPKVSSDVMAALSLIPDTLHSETPRSAIPKSLFYFYQIGDCIGGCRTIDRCLPSNMRASAALPYSSVASTNMKATTWDAFASGNTRILCATDAAGMGCNIGDIEYCAVFDVKGRHQKADGAVLTMPNLSQRWGRTGRDPATQGVCILFAPDYAFVPPPPPPIPAAVPAVARLRGRPPKKKKLEPAKWTKLREKLSKSLVAFINLGWSGHAERLCAHRFVEQEFRPDTGLTVYTTLDMSDTPVTGRRAQKLRFDAIWLVLNVRPVPPPGEKCGKCWVCNPELLNLIHSVPEDDTRFGKFKNDFLRPLRSSQPSEPVDVADDAASNASAQSDSDRSADSVSIVGQSQPSAPSTPSRRVARNMQRSVLQEHVDDLYDRLLAWRSRYAETECGLLTSAQSVMPDAVVNQLCKNSEHFANLATITVADIRRKITWDLARPAEIDGAVAVLTAWVTTVPHLHSPRATPASARRATKRTRLDAAAVQPVRSNTPHPRNNAPLQMRAAAASGPDPLTPSRNATGGDVSVHDTGPAQPSTPSRARYDSQGRAGGTPAPAMLMDTPRGSEIPDSPSLGPRQLRFADSPVLDHARRLHVASDDPFASAPPQLPAPGVSSYAFSITPQMLESRPASIAGINHHASPMMHVGSGAARSPFPQAPPPHWHAYVRGTFPPPNPGLNFLGHQNGTGNVMDYAQPLPISPQDSPFVQQHLSQRPLTMTRSYNPYSTPYNSYLPTPPSSQQYLLHVDNSGRQPPPPPYLYSTPHNHFQSNTHPPNYPMYDNTRDNAQ